MKSPKAPAAPDPNVVSAAQTTSNKQTAEYENALTHGNVYTPLGNQTFASRIDPTTGATVFDQTVSLAPEQQKLLDLQNEQDLALGNTSQAMLSQVADAYAKQPDLSSMPGRAQTPDAANYLEAPTAPTLQKSLNINGPELAQGINMEGLPKLYGADDLMGARDQVADALYRRQSAYLDPQYSQREAQLNTDLANKGVAEGSEAWRNARDQFARERAFEYERARDSSITGSGNELGLLSGIASNNRGQIFGERSAEAGFTNQARQQALAEAMQVAGFGNEVAMTENDAALANAGFTNQARSSAANDAMSRAAFQNQSRDAAISEAMSLRSLPMNEFNALRTASQVNVPQFSTPATAGVATTDVSGNTWNAYNANLAQWQQKMQNRNALMSGLFSLGSSAISAKK